jgi:transcriptional antiterminator NusG
LYSGYLYFEATSKLNDDDLKGIAILPNIMGMGGDRTPVLLRENDIRRILKDDSLETHVESKKLKYTKGEIVKVIEGPFSSFDGVISEIKGDKVDIEIKIFGRNTAVSLTLNQIEKY